MILGGDLVALCRGKFEMKLDLSKARSVIFFYGKTGAGKSHVAKLVAELSGRYLYEADKDITPEIVERIKLGKPLTQALRDQYFEVLAERIRQHTKEHKKIVVSQAIYKRKNRRFLRKKIPDLELVYVHASQELIRARLLVRSDLVSPEYADKISAEFEEPESDDKILFNQLDDNEIVRQLNQLFSFKDKDHRKSD